MKQITQQWLTRWAKAHAAAGGWAGPATIAALTPRAIELRESGATARLAGMATAREYELHSSMTHYKELAS